MKKILMGFAAFTLMLSSCSENEVIDNVNSEKGLIKFSAIAGNVSTKATERVISDLQTNGVTVFALTKDLPSGTTYIPYFTERLTYTTAWAPGIKRYLKEGVKNEFYSIYPAVSGVTEQTLADAGVGFDYTVNTTADEDLLGAAATGTYAPSADGSADVPVLLPFNHLLSQVNLGVKLDNTPVTGIGNVVITDISFNNVGAKGSYKFGTEGKGVDSQWTADATAPRSDFTIAEGIDTVNETAETTVTGGVFLPGGTGVFATDMATSSLMPMPLAFSTSTITFTFRAYDLAGKEVTNGETSGTINLDATNIAWKQGLRYVYVVDFEPWFKNRELKFTVTLSDWENYDWNDVTGAGTGVVDVALSNQP